MFAKEIIQKKNSLTFATKVLMFLQGSGHRIHGMLLEGQKDLCSKKWMDPMGKESMDIWDAEMFPYFSDFLSQIPLGSHKSPVQSQV